MTQINDWFVPYGVENIPSPALLLFKDRVEANIENVIKIAGDTTRLRPHVKTHKLPEVVAMHQKHGIQKLKCATIAEAEMVALCGVPDILLAYQPVGPNQDRLIELAKTFSSIQFGCLVDNEKTLRQLAAKMNTADFQLNIWIDVDNGNGRTGIQPGSKAENLAKLIVDSNNLTFAGLHVYDGQFGGLPFEERKSGSDSAFESVNQMIHSLEQDGVEVKNIVAGGSPTFPVHSLRDDVDLSPGTYVFWDAGYGQSCPELPFQPAAILITRVVSKPGHNKLCLDLGHKSVSAENPIDKRVRFLNAPEASFVDQKEEHLVIELPNRDDFEVGDILYGVPWHVCPTVALHQEVVVIDKNKNISDKWQILARNRRLNF